MFILACCLDFDALLQSSTVNDWIAGSKCSASLEKWVSMRKFIVSAFHHDGSILDVGCANGFLLRCFIKWSSFEHLPYGIETDASLYESKRLFPQHNDDGHFIKIELKDYLEKPQIEAPDFPDLFDFIYWNVWSDGMDFESSSDFNYITGLLRKVRVGGRLIMGFYSQRDRNNAKIQRIIEYLNVEVTVLNCDDDACSHQIAWIDA